MTAAEVLPQPTAATGVVFVDASARTLTVRLGDQESGYAKTLWRSGWTALRRAEEGGWRTDVPSVWASAPGHRQIVHGLPGDGGTLVFTFPPGTAAYAELVGKPRLTSIVTMDVNSHRILGIRFLHRPG